MTGISLTYQEELDSIGVKLEKLQQLSDALNAARLACTVVLDAGAFQIDRYHAF